MLPSFVTRYRLFHQHQPPSTSSPRRHLQLDGSSKSPPAAAKSLLKSRMWPTGRVQRSLGALRWLKIPLGAGVVCLAYFQIKLRWKPEPLVQKTPRTTIATHVEVSAYKALPLNAVSRLWGRIHNVQLPWWLRKPILRLYATYYACNLSEAAEPDLAKYPNLGEFFRRTLKEGARPIHPGPCLVSPADGEVLHLGSVESNHVEQVKGVQYPLYAFLGPNTWNTTSAGEEEGNEQQDKQLTDYHQSLLMNGGALYHCVIYLAPGDYHRFHSPVDWDVMARRHFPGALLSVCRGIASWVPGLFHINERVVYTGKWRHGFFAMAPVGATNVGSIKVYFDEELKTNKKKCPKKFSDATFENVFMKKGECFGEFNLGSTIVLVFEAPPGSTFDIAPGQKVKYGQKIFVETSEEQIEPCCQTSAA